MIGSINSTTNYASQSQGKLDRSLSEDQKNSVADILSNYDADSLSSDDASSIVDAFKELGIVPGADLKDAIQTAGFDAETIKSLGDESHVGINSHKPPPPPPPLSQAEIEEEATILEEYLASLFEIDDETDTSSQIVDYTSRIMNLTDDAKSEVQALFEQYSPDNSDYSKSESGVLIADALTDILGTANNYNHISVYA